MITRRSTRRGNENVHNAQQNSTARSALQPLSFNTPLPVRKRASLKRKKASPTTNDAVVHRKKTFTCDLCQRHVGTKGGLKYHIKAHLFGRPFKCNVCKKSFATNNDLITHKKGHGLRFSCDFCQQLFNTKHNAANHIALVHLPKVLPCNVCGRRYATNSVLNRHKQIYHHARKTVAVKKPPKSAVCHLCDLCGEVLTSKKSGRPKGNAKNFMCATCDDKFTCKLVSDENCRCPECVKNNTPLQWNAEEASFLESVPPVTQLADFVESFFNLNF